MDEMIADEDKVSSQRTEGTKRQKDEIENVTSIIKDIMHQLLYMIKRILGDDHEIECVEYDIPPWFSNVIKSSDDNEAHMQENNCVALYELKIKIKEITDFWKKVPQEVLRNRKKGKKRRRSNRRTRGHQ